MKDTRNAYDEMSRCHDIIERIGHYHLTSPARQLRHDLAKLGVNASRLCTHILYEENRELAAAIRRVQADNLVKGDRMLNWLLALINKRQKQTGNFPG
ncbi:hypothetical protein SPFM1_00166 [Salmonella phage SPFM1]|nr:hypothetical protein SPFM1_00166 [Salmonella phage SPFM1]